MDGYRVHIQDFDGPLDLLLHLIEKAEVNIEDIFVSEITAEYLEYSPGTCCPGLRPWRRGRRRTRRRPSSAA